jgi:hypothetical protein
MPVDLQSRLGGAKAKYGKFGDIVVQSVDICVGMVQDIAFDFPDHGITPETIYSEAKQSIYPFPARIASMTSIMHDVEGNRDQRESQQDGQ